MAGLVQKAYFSDNLVKKAPHYHDRHQIILIVNGDVEFTCGKNKYNAGAGDILIFSRYENHAVNVLSEQYVRYVLYIDPEVSGIENRFYSLLSNRPEGFKNAVDVKGFIQEFITVFDRIIKEYNVKEKLSDDMLQILVNELLIMVYRRLPDTSFFEGENTEMVYALQRRFERDFAKPYNLLDLAKDYNVSPSTLSHHFKRITGVSVMEYLLYCRMASAKNYLTGTNLTVGEIVEKCGFSNVSNFSRTFKSLNGISPTDFRNKYR
ncbi:MAG: helix-turn-helix domain-containing protein [Ruminococcaceae bacterium]|nr:helix-turn-helix domain-containing protein [Oscillospiraceae bacterium]